MSTVRYRIEFRIFRALSWIVIALPERAALGLCSLLGWFVGVVVGVRRVDTHQHLQIAFPERDPAWRRRVARGSYMHLAREGAMTIRLYRMAPEEIVRRTEIVGFEALRDAAAGGNGAVVISGHLGNWEVAAAAVAVRGVPMDVAAHLQKNPLFYHHMVELRDRLGLTVIVKNEAFRLVPAGTRCGPGGRTHFRSEHAETWSFRRFFSEGLQPPRRVPRCSPSAPVPRSSWASRSGSRVTPPGIV